MILSFIKPGTKIMCIDNVPIPSDFAYYGLLVCKILGNAPCQPGKVYTVGSIVEVPWMAGGLGVRVEEDLHQRLLLRFFRPLQLPNLLTDILDRAPAHDEECVG